MQHRKVKRALLSVSNKSGLLNLASKLVENGVEIIASDGTAAFLRESKISVRTVTEVTGSPEMLGGRVKTLHPLIHGAILASDHDGEEVARLGIGLIDLVVINFYPSDFFDIGGPALVRAAAKNYERVAIITSPDQYVELTQSLEPGSDVTRRKRWARCAIEMTAKYDLEILTLPRTLISGVEIKQSSTQIISIPGSGMVDIRKSLAGSGSIYLEENGKLTWVYNLRDDLLNEIFYLQPGNYRIEFRRKDLQDNEKTNYKSFSVKSGTNQIITVQ